MNVCVLIDFDDNVVVVEMDLDVNMDVVVVDVDVNVVFGDGVDIFESNISPKCDVMDAHWKQFP